MEAAGYRSPECWREVRVKDIHQRMEAIKGQWLGETALGGRWKEKRKGPRSEPWGQWTLRILEVEKDSVEEKAVELVSG